VHVTSHVVRRASIQRLFLFYPCYAVHRHLHSFPTRRSSDLPCRLFARSRNRYRLRGAITMTICRPSSCGNCSTVPYSSRSFCSRSEEHTSELQSRENLVCRLLLEKKKQKKIPFGM